MIEVSDDPLKVLLVYHGFNHVHDKLALLINKLVKHEFRWVRHMQRLKRIPFITMLGLFVHRVDRLHDMVPVKKDSETHYLLMVPDALSNSL